MQKNLVLCALSLGLIVLVTGCSGGGGDAEATPPAEKTGGMPAEMRAQAQGQGEAWGRQSEAAPTVDKREMPR